MVVLTPTNMPAMSDACGSGRLVLMMEVKSETDIKNENTVSKREKCEFEQRIIYSALSDSEKTRLSAYF